MDKEDLILKAGNVTMLSPSFQLEMLRELMTNEGWEKWMDYFFPFFSNQNKSKKDVFHHVEGIYEELSGGLTRFVSYDSYRVYSTRLAAARKLANKNKKLLPKE